MLQSLLMDTLEHIILIEKAISKLLNKSNVNWACEIYFYFEYIYGNYIVTTRLSHIIFTYTLVYYKHIVVSNFHLLLTIFI